MDQYFPPKPVPPVIPVPPRQNNFILIILIILLCSGTSPFGGFFGTSQ